MSADEAAVMEGMQKATPARRSRGGLWLVTLLALLLAGGGGAAWYLGWLPGQAEADAGNGVDRRAPIYHTLDSNLVVNFRGTGRARYLQVGIEVMARDPAAIEALREHSAVVRNNLIMLLSDQSQDELASREGKEALQQAALAEIQAVLIRHFGEPGVESVYFTSFVMQ